MTNPSLLRRIEALESVQSPRKPVFLWKPFDRDVEKMTTFEAELAVAEAANPNSQIYVLSWQEPT